MDDTELITLIDLWSMTDEGCSEKNNFLQPHLATIRKLINLELSISHNLYLATEIMIGQLSRNSLQHLMLAFICLRMRTTKSAGCTTIETSLNAKVAPSRSTASASSANWLSTDVPSHLPVTSAPSQCHLHLSLVEQEFLVSPDAGLHLLAHAHHKVGGLHHHRDVPAAHRRPQPLHCLRLLGKQAQRAAVHLRQRPRHQAGAVRAPNLRENARQINIY